MYKILLIVFCIMVLGLLAQCKRRYDQISASELHYLKQQYAIDAINYFYEIAFFQDYVAHKNFVSKWDHDIWIYLEGALWPDDSLHVINAVDQINELKLPIQLHLTTDPSLANLKVYFGDFTYLEKKLGVENYMQFRGIGLLYDRASKIDSAKIGIANNANSYQGLNASDSMIMRQSIILEEITQALGLTGDSWLHDRSVFYEGKNKVLHLDEMDKQIIHLLYESGLPIVYPRKQFEKDFEDMLHHKNAVSKLINYVEKHHVPVSYLECIKENSFNDSLLFKYPKRVFVKLEGDFRSQDLAFAEHAVEKFNTVSDQLQLEIAPNDRWHEYPCINIEYIEDSTLQTSLIAERFLVPAAMMFTRRINGTIKLRYKKSGMGQDQLSKNKLLFESMYKLLGMDHVNDEIAEVDAANNILFKSDYEKILSLLYNPVLPDGISQQEIDEVLKALQ